ncbi:hypothetical protein [Tenacibaculum sp. IB213877]|uniref:hypothetical protein n=1 Tax=Tenacibaculum sp. IB213877 TaxID=3097351 RepID=UPI002A5A6733|nr:hypothetical protein [Tenacibaculum sp. IB213877]MDY0781344.1 hypothetical protein [Tenacibaculum sp. IB213877]
MIKKKVRVTLALASGTYEQFKAYVKSKREFKYYFNDNASQMKLKFQDVFKDADKAEELWELNKEFFKSLNNQRIKELDDLIDLAKNNELVDYINWIE